jgi:hypothetical protein
MDRRSAPKTLDRWPNRASNLETLVSLGHPREPLKHLTCLRFKEAVHLPIDISHHDMILQFSAFSPNTRCALAFALAAIIFLSPLSLTVSAAPNDPTPDSDYFLIYETAGGSACRIANAFERSQLERIRPRDLRQINHLGEVNKGALSAEDLPQHLTINLRATPNLEANAPAKAAFLRAVAAWEAVVTSPVTIYLDADFGPNNFGQPWGTGVLGATSSPSLSNVNYTVVRNALIGGANTPAKLAVYNALPAAAVPTDTGSFSNISVSSSIARAIGLLDFTAQPGDLAARIGFNSGKSFDFDPSDGITFNQLDFEAVATHEIGHALGFTSRNGFPSGATPAMWDLYRFRSGTTSATFQTAQRIMTIGGPTLNSHYYFVPGETEIGLSDTGPDPENATPNNTDGNQSSHWREASKNGFVYIGIMDPRIPNGTRRLITDNDRKALNIFGYNSNITGPPAPPPNDNFASAQVINGCSGTVTGTNVGATRETNEPNHSPDNGGGSRSVWYQWLSPGTGSVTITTAGSGYDTVLGVYTGNSVGGLSEVGGSSKSDDVSPTDKTSSVTISATAGTTYRIAVDGYNNSGSGGDVGPITLNWNASNCSAGPTYQILLDETGPAADQASAVDSILFLRDPFLVINSANVINPGSDPNTRVIIFVSSLTLLPGEPASTVVVNLIDSNNQSYDISAQDVRVVPNFDFTQITFRLPSNLPAGTCRIKVVSHSLFSNTATFRIRI